MSLGLGLGVAIQRVLATGGGGATVPQAPTIGAATAGAGSAEVAFTANGDGGSAITGFTVTPYRATLIDTATASGSPTFSNGDLSVETLDATNFKPTIPVPSGPTAFRVVADALGAPSGGAQTIIVGVIDAAWNVTVGMVSGASPYDGWVLSQDGWFTEPQGTATTDLGRTVDVGEAFHVYIDRAAGKCWLDNDANSTAADREAGTNPTFTFTPGMALVFGVGIYSNDAATLAKVTLDPTHSSGRFAALGAMHPLTELAVTDAASPITVPGLTAGIEYTFTAYATNAEGDSAESDQSNAVTPTAPLMWDSAAAGPDMVLSNGDLTATMPYTDYAGYPGYTLREGVRGTTSRDTGKHAFSAIPTYQNTPGEGESAVGVADADFSPTTVQLWASGLTFAGAGTWLLQADGLLFNNGASTDISLPFASDATLYFYLDLDAGKGWIDTVADTTAADREAGTNPTFTFTANTPLWPIACLAPTTSPAGVALVDIAGHSSGTFLDW